MTENSSYFRKKFLDKAYVTLFKELQSDLWKNLDFKMRKDKYEYCTRVYKYANDQPNNSMINIYK